MKELYEAVIFDMDGVIFDSERATMECWLILAKKYDIRNLEKPYLACTGTNASRTKEIMLEAYGPSFDYDKFAHEASVMYHEKYDGGRLPLKPGVRELLEYLKVNDKKIALASSTRQKTVTEQLEFAGLYEYFDSVICGDMVKKSKPDPEIYIVACNSLNVKPSCAYAIEDSYNGIRSAFAAGMRPIMVPDLLPASEEMLKLSETIKNNLNEVTDYLVHHPANNRTK